MIGEARRFGDLLSLEERPVADVAALAGGGEIYWFDLSPVDDTDLWMAVTGLSPGGEPLPWRFYTRRQCREQLAHLDLGDVRALTLGREVLEPEAPRDLVLPAAPREAQETKPELEQEADAVQTEQEVRVGADPAVIKAIGGFFNPPGLGQCAPGFRSTVDALPWPLTDGREVPRLVVKSFCVAGNILLSETVFPVPDDPGSPTRAKICSTRFRFENTRRAVYDHVQKSTKLSVGLGLGFTAGGGLQFTGAKEGDPVFGAGEAKIDAKTGKELKFDFGLVRTHAKLKIQAFEKLVLDVPEMTCQPA